MKVNGHEVEVLQTNFDICKEVGLKRWQKEEMAYRLAWQMIDNDLIAFVDADRNSPKTRHKCIAYVAVIKPKRSVSDEPVHL